jgi:hypothetical protein
MLGTNVGALGCVDVFMCTPGVTSLIHDRVRLTRRDTNAVSVTVSSSLGTTFGSDLSFFVRIFLCFVMLFLFRFMSRFIFTLGSTSLGSELLLFTLEGACLFASFYFVLDAGGCFDLPFFCFFAAGAGDGAGSVASLLSSRAHGFYFGSNKQTKGKI